MLRSSRCSTSTTLQPYAPRLQPYLILAATLCAQVIALLDEYHLSKDDFDAIMELELLSSPGTLVT